MEEVNTESQTDETEDGSTVSTTRESPGEEAETLSTAASIDAEAPEAADAEAATNPEGTDEVAAAEEAAGPADTPAEGAEAIEGVEGGEAAVEVPAEATEEAAIEAAPAAPSAREEVDRDAPVTSIIEQPAPSPTAPIEEGLAFDLTTLIGVIIAVLIAALLVHALRRQRRLRREEMSHADQVHAETESPHPPEGSLQPPGPDVTPIPPVDEGPPSSPEALRVGRELEEKTEKQKRREEFLEQQHEARELREREEAKEEARGRAAAEEAARKAAEEEEQREAEAAARREALLASSGPLTERLSKTRGGLVGKLQGILGKRIDDATLEQIEEVLFTADIGVQTAGELLDTVRENLKKTELGDPELVMGALKAHISRTLNKNGVVPGKEAIDPDNAPAKPMVIMVVGVNGVGKTTTIGKLAGRYIAQGKKVIVAAGDTFRAAAVEQLEIWADRVGCEIVKGAEGADPASVTFDAVKKGVADGADVVIVDTAGRLHTKIPLMEELSKVQRVLGKAREGAPDEILLVVDATTGQNALQQARLFREAVPITSIALTKLDGTAKGGVVIGITGELDLPVRYIGVGEKVGDLRPFDAEEFVAALFT